MQTLYDEVATRQERETPRRQYVAGVIEGAPFDVVVAGGISFAKFRDRLQKNPDGTWARIPIYGAITHALSEAEVAAVKAGVARKGIRGDGPRKDWVNFDAPTYRRHPSDQPVARWLTLWPYEPTPEGERPLTLLEIEEREQARRVEEKAKGERAEEIAVSDPRDAGVRRAAAAAKKHQMASPFAGEVLPGA